MMISTGISPTLPDQTNGEELANVLQRMFDALMELGPADVMPMMKIVSPINDLKLR